MLIQFSLDNNVADNARKQPTIAECDAQFIRPGTLFEMDIEEVNGRKYKVWKHGHRTIRPYLLECMNKWADRVFINAPRDEPYSKDERFDYTFAEVHVRSVRLAAWLYARGVRMGTRVGLMGFNSVEWVQTYVAINLLGAVPVIVNAWVQPDSLKHCLCLARPSLVLADARSADAVVPFAGDLAAAGVNEILAWSPTSHLENKNLPWIDYANLPASPEDILAVVSGAGLETLGPHSPGAIFFTSGTTGLPKGVPISQSSILQNLKSGQSSAIRAGLRAGAPLDMALKMVVGGSVDQVRSLHAVPLFHITGCGLMVLAFNEGRRLHFMRKWSINDAVSLLVKYQISSIGGVPTIASSIIQSPLLPKDFQLGSASYGGAAPPARLAQDMKERFPQIILGHAWGMTEVGGLITSFMGQDYVDRPKSCGPPVPAVEVRVVDLETHKPVPPGTVGMLEIRGYSLLQGYLDDPVATAKSFDKDGWFETGDAGYIDKDGFVYVSDRIKDIIIRGGENISSEEVENAVYLDDRVAEAASVPVPDDRLGELVAVAVSLKPGKSATPDDIIAAVAPRLRREARPTFVWVSNDVLPMNANGKFIKAEIKRIVGDLYQQHLSRQSKL